MAFSPFKFLQEVRTETAKVTWPTRKETLITTGLVFVMGVAASIFFLAADFIIHWAVGLVLGLGISETDATASFAKLLATPSLGTLSAIGKRRAFGFWHLFNDTPLHVVAIEALAKWLHPERFADIDPAAIGLSLQAMISVSLQSNARGKIGTFIEQIRRKPQVMDVYFLAGADDFIIHVAARDTDDLRAFVVENLNADADVAGTQTSLIFEHLRGAAPL